VVKVYCRNIRNHSLTYVSNVPKVLKRTAGKLTKCLAVSVDTVRVRPHSSTADGLTKHRADSWATSICFLGVATSALDCREVWPWDSWLATSVTPALTFNTQYRSILGRRPNSIPKSEIIGAYSHLPHFMWRSGGYVPLFPLWHCYSNQVNWRSFIGPYVGPLIIGVTWQYEGLVCGEDVKSRGWQCGLHSLNVSF